MEVVLDRNVFLRGLSATSAFRLRLLSSSAPGQGDGRRGVRLGVLGVACKSRVLMSNARSFVAASRIESTPGKKNRVRM